MKVLLFGASGQVGWRVKQALGDSCVALTRGQCDLSSLDEAQAKTIIAKHAPDIIINAAGFTAVDAAEQQRELAIQINAHAPGMLARAAGDIPFIHLSTDYVFDGASGPYREEAIIAPQNAYGASKWRGEQEIRDAGGRAYIFRLQWLYDNRGTNFFLTMKKLMAERTSLRVVADQFGAPTSARFVAETLVAAAKKIHEGNLPPGTYHLTNDGHTSWHGFACAIAAALKAPLSLLEPLVSEEYPTPASRPRNARLDCTKLATHGIVMPHWRASFAQLLEENDAHR